MSHSLSPGSSASARNTPHKPAEKQTSIFSYFASQSNRPKRKRRNLDIHNTDSETENAKKKAASNAQNTDVEKDKDLRQCDPANDGKYDCFKSSVPVCLVSTVYSSQQSDSDSSDVIPPSPTVANNSLTLTGRMKRESIQHGNTVAVVSAEAADQSETAELANCLLDSNNLHCITSSVQQPLHRAAIFQHQPKIKDIDRHAPLLHKPADHLCESDEDEDVRDSELLSIDIPSPLLSDDDKEFSSKLPVTEENTDSRVEDTESYSLQLTYQATRRRFMEKVIIMLTTINVYVQKIFHFINFCILHRLYMLCLYILCDVLQVVCL